MLQVDMSASVRESFGKGAMRRLRGEGITPAVLYGNNKGVTSLQLETKPFLKSLYQISRKNAVVNLSVDGDTRHVMMREIQTDPVKDTLIHADFYEIDLGQARTFSVNVEIVGKAIGVDRGGELVVHSSVVELEGAPLDIPDSVTVDVTSLDGGQSITFGSLELPEKVTLVSDADKICVEVESASSASGADDAEGNAAE